MAAECEAVCNAKLDAEGALHIWRGTRHGEISDLGPQWCLWFEDPDGMRAEVCWIRDD